MPLRLLGDATSDRSLSDLITQSQPTSRLRLLKPEEMTEADTALVSGAKSFAKSAVPTTAAVLTGLKATGAIASKLAPYAKTPWTAIGAGALSLGGGLLAGFAASQGANWMQNKAIKAIMGEDWQKEMEQQEAINRQQHPYATLGGELTSQALSLRPSIKSIKTAWQAGKTLLSGTPEARTALLTTEIGKKQLSELMNVGFGSGTQVATEGYQQIQEGDFKPAKLAMAGIFGALLSEPRGYASKPWFNRARQITGVKPTDDISKHVPVEPPKPEEPLTGHFEQPLPEPVKQEITTPAETSQGIQPITRQVQAREKRVKPRVPTTFDNMSDPELRTYLLRQGMEVPEIVKMSKQEMINLANDAEALQAKSQYLKQPEQVAKEPIVEPVVQKPIEQPKVEPAIQTERMKDMMQAVERKPVIESIQEKAETSNDNIVSDDNLDALADEYSKFYSESEAKNAVPIRKTEAVPMVKTPQDSETMGKGISQQEGLARTQAEAPVQEATKQFRGVEELSTGNIKIEHEIEKPQRNVAGKTGYDLYRITLPNGREFQIIRNGKGWLISGAKLEETNLAKGTATELVFDESSYRTQIEKIKKAYNEGRLSEPSFKPVESKSTKPITPTKELSLAEKVDKGKPVYVPPEATFAEITDVKGNKMVINTKDLDTAKGANIKDVKFGTRGKGEKFIPLENYQDIQYKPVPESMLKEAGVKSQDELEKAFYKKGLHKNNETPEKFLKRAYCKGM